MIIELDGDIDEQGIEHIYQCSQNNKSLIHIIHFSQAGFPPFGNNSRTKNEYIPIKIAQKIKVMSQHYSMAIV